VKTPSTLQAFRGEILPASVQLLQADDPVAIDGHRLAGRLRSSGTGVVYLARDGGAGLVAVKTPRARTTEHAPVRGRLRTEAVCARRLPSFCTARLLHDGTDETPPYLINEYVEGPSLEQVVDVKGPLAPALVKTLAAELARAIAAIHDAGVIHCNLTPANVLLANDCLRVIDFGVAQEISASGEPAEIGAVADSPGWLAPELLTGGPPSPACDVFGWGCLVSYAATGHSPYGETGAGELGRSARFQPPEAGALDEPIRHLVEASVTEDPADRPTAADLIARLDVLASAATDHPPARNLNLFPPLGTATHGITHHVPDHRAGPTTGKPRHPRRAKALAAASVLVTLAAALLVAAPTETDPYPGPSKALSPSHPTKSLPKASHHSAIRGPRQAGSGPPHPKSVADAPNASGVPTPGEPRFVRWRIRFLERMEPRPPRSIRMSCVSVRFGWCSKFAAKAVSARERSPGWPISWTSTG
jgi:serine/threonine protein kinase